MSTSNYNLSKKNLDRQLSVIRERIGSGLTTKEKEIALCAEHFLRYRPYPKLKHMTDFLVGLAIEISKIGEESDGK